MTLGSDEVLARLLKLHPKIIDLTLERVERLLAKVGSPERRLPPVVHVAGTNAKGSVIAYLRAMLEADGKRVHVYTSPHLVRFHERIRLAGRLIPESDLLNLLQRCEDINGAEPITFFEITTVAAFLAFTETPADVLLLETGLGGRLDATNMVDAPLVSVITPISIDHTQYLGDTLEKIAFEKAGILKAGRPAVIGEQPPSVHQVLRERARAVGAPLFQHGRDWDCHHWDCHERGSALVFNSKGAERVYPLPNLPGAHQLANAGLAIAAAQKLGDLMPSEEAQAKGLLSASWPARLQRLPQERVAERLGPDWEIWLDGGHNVAAGEILARQAETWRDRPLHIIYGMLNTKDARGFLRPLLPQAASLQAIAIPGEANSLSAEEAAAAAGGKARPAKDLTAALAHLKAEGQAGRVLICGSLYLAGRVLAHFGWEG